MKKKQKYDPVAAKKYREAHKEENRLYQIEYRKKNIIELSAKAKQYRKRMGKSLIAARDRRAALKYKYKMTPEQYNQMYKDQDGSCKICGKHIAGKSAHIDHNHSTGQIRGLLCVSCNWGMSFFDSGFLAKALIYVQ